VIDVDMVRVAKYVAPDRCICCGHKLITWSPRAIVEAAIRWSDEHGYPPITGDWETATPANPSHSTVEGVFGPCGWNRMLLAAGLPLRVRRGSLRWTKDTIAEAMLDELLRTGKWPVAWRWEKRAGDWSRPCTATVLRVFGTWAAAKKYAGWDGAPQAPAVRTPSAVAKPTCCTGCGCEFTTFSRGCKQCIRRRAARKARANKSETVAAPSLVESSPVDSEAGARNRQGAATPFAAPISGEAEAPAAQTRRAA
jgi:hypothetical protein